MNKSCASGFVLLAAVIGLLVLTGAFYVVPETEQVIVTQFGKPIGGAITKAGIHFKVPFIHDVHRIDKRVLEWDGPSAEMPTKDKLYLIVDAFARWKIKDPLQFYLRMRDERSALSRLDDILGSEMRNTIARHELVELVRSTKGRRAALDEAAVAAAGTAAGTAPTDLPPIQYGRLALEDEVSKTARVKLQEFGIELLDIRFKRINYNPAVSGKIFERMMSERRQIAEGFRSEGAGEAARIMGKKERDLKEIDSGAYRKVQNIEGKADAEAISIYAQAYNTTPEAREFYTFQRALEVYRTAFARDTTVVFTAEGSFLRYLKGETPAPGGPARPSAPPPPSAPAPPPAP